MSLPSRTALRRGEACRLGSSGAMAQSYAITLKTTLNVYHKFSEFTADLISMLEVCAPADLARVTRSSFPSVPGHRSPWM
jgi:hypothetical protein